MNYDDFLAYAKANGKGSNPFEYAPEQMARQLGYSGQSRIELGLGGSPSESTGLGTEMQYGIAPEFQSFLKGFDYQPGMQGKNADVDIRDAAGNIKAENFRTGDHKGTAMKIASVAIPALVAGGFGAGIGGAMGFGPMAGGGVPGAGPAIGNGAFLGEAAWAPTAGELGTTGLNAMRAGELASYATSGAMPSSAASAGGGLLDSAMNAAGSAAGWMKENPMLGKALMSGGMGLLSGGGGGGGGSAQAPTYGPATQWNSPIQQGIQSNPQQMNPAPIQQRPAGLLAQGQQNDGAWRFLGGK